MAGTAAGSRSSWCSCPPGNPPAGSARHYLTSSPLFASPNREVPSPAADGIAGARCDLHPSGHAATGQCLHAALCPGAAAVLSACPASPHHGPAGAGQRLAWGARAPGTLGTAGAAPPRGAAPRRGAAPTRACSQSPCLWLGTARGDGDAAAPPAKGAGAGGRGPGGDPGPHGLLPAAPPGPTRPPAPPPPRATALGAVLHTLPSSAQKPSVASSEDGAAIEDSVPAASPHQPALAPPTGRTTPKPKGEFWGVAELTGGWPS